MGQLDENAKIFTDFDEFATAVRSVDCKMIAHNAASHLWKLNIANAGNVEVQFGSLGSGNILEGKSWKDAFVFYLPLSPKTRYSVNGVTISQNGFMVLEPRSPFLLSSNDQHNWISISIPRDLFLDFRHLTTKLLTNDINSPQSWSTASRPEMAHFFASLAQEILIASASSDDFASSAAGRRAENEILKVCRRIYAAERLDRMANSDSRKLIQRAAAYIQASNCAELESNVSDMAGSIGMPERTLRAVFSDFYSTSPKKFLALSVMRDVNHELRHANPRETSVSSVLINHKIFEFGRFSGRYKEIYGELPSETLHKPPP